MAQAIASFKDGFFTADNFDGKKGKGYMELRTGNDKENSLATIVKFIKLVSDHEKARRSSVEETAVDSTDIMTEDSTAVIQDVAPAPVK
jgi:hypothetical protein